MNWNYQKTHLWDHAGALFEEEREYFIHEMNSNEDPFGYFYLLYKIHKLESTDNTTKIPTRPVCSSCGSLDHEKLQPVAQAQPSYFKNSFECLKMMKVLELQ